MNPKNNLEQKEAKPGYFRITTKRKGPGPKPLPGETVMDGDRKHPVLGNPHILHNHNDPVERVQVIEAYRQDLEKDWTNQGPLFQEINRLAREVGGGAKIACQCWCKPRPCHLDHVASKVNQLVKEWTGQSPHGPEGVDLVEV